MRVGADRSRQRWMVAGFFLLSGILTATWNARIPDVQQGLGLNDAAWGTVLVALPAGLVTGLFLSSWLVAHFGTLRVTLVTSLLACLLLLLLGWAPHRFSLIKCRKNSPIPLIQTVWSGCIGATGRSNSWYSNQIIKIVRHRKLYASSKHGFFKWHVFLSIPAKR